VATSPAEGALTQRVRAAFRDNPALNTLAQNINIGEQNGKIILTGSVPHAEEKELVGSIVAKTAGVRSVDNRLQVRRFGSPQFAAAQPLPHIYSNAPSIDQTLTPTSERLDQPSRIYSEGPGARKGAGPEQNSGQTFKVTVEAAERADQQLGSKLAQALRADTSLAALVSTIHIYVDNSKVTLRGTVRNAEEKAKLQTAVERATGVTEVVNELHVANVQVGTSR
jgi:osmotically-inducible protein OsmY